MLAYLCARQKFIFMLTQMFAAATVRLNHPAMKSRWRWDQREHACRSEAYRQLAASNLNLDLSGIPDSRRHAMSLPQCIVDFLDHASTIQPQATTCRWSRDAGQNVFVLR